MSQPAQSQEVPGVQSERDPVPDCGGESYVGSGRLTGKVAVITGGESGIGRAVAIAYAREGADLVVAYLSEDEDARSFAGYVEDAGRRCVLVPGDVSQPQHCRDLIAKTVEELGRVDVLVDNSAFQMDHESIEEIPDEEWDHTSDTKVPVADPRPRPRRPSRTSPRAWPSCSRRAASVPTAWRRARSGRR